MAKVDDELIKSTAFSIAHGYAWNWFAYHADQRLKSFNFFFVLVGALTAGYLAAIGYNQRDVAVALAAILFVTSVVFWRLDKRNSILIKISECYLQRSEERLAAYVGDEIKLASIADLPSDRFVLKPFPRFISTYRTIFRLVFISVMLLSVVLIFHAFSAPSIDVFDVTAETKTPSSTDAEN